MSFARRCVSMAERALARRGAGIGVEVDPPHLENDDVVLAQAGLIVKFDFDQKGFIGLNDGEASGGQQVMKSFILLVALMMDETRPGGLYSSTSRFAHLDIFNIDKSGAFLDATRAAYILTTPNTHTSMSLAVGSDPRYRQDADRKRRGHLR